MIAQKKLLLQVTGKHLLEKAELLSTLRNTEICYVISNTGNDYFQLAFAIMLPEKLNENVAHITLPH